MITFDFETYMKKPTKEVDVQNLIEKLKQDELNAWYESLEETYSIKNLANNIRDNFDVFLVIGIGGSILGSKGIIEALTPYINSKKIIYVGNNLSSEYINEVIEYIKDKKVFANVISKSGDTIEVNIAFELLYPYLEKENILITTSGGKLYETSLKEGIKVLPFPKNVGGRYSVFKISSLLPISVAKIDIMELLKGTEKAKTDIKNIKKYLEIRQSFYEEGYSVEFINVYEPKLASLIECIEQILAETQGKENKGLLPVSVVNTGKLHSLGQYIEEGKNIGFETTILVENTNDIFVKSYNKNLNQINTLAAISVAKSHFIKNRYTSLIKLDKLNEYNIGYLITFYMMVSSRGSYLFNVNYYDQPGVSKYKEILSQNL